MYYLKSNYLPSNLRAYFEDFENKVLDEAADKIFS